MNSVSPLDGVRATPRLQTGAPVVRSLDVADARNAQRPSLDGHRETLDRRVLRACDAVGAFIEYWGFKAVHGRVWTLLALHRRPLSQSEIVERLGVSKALVSTTISELSGFGLVRPVSDRRNAPYEAVVNVWPTIADVLRSREWMLLEEARVALEAAIEEGDYVEARHGGSPYDVGRLKLLLSMTEMAQALLKTLIALRLPQPSAAVRSWIKTAASLVKRMR